MDILYLNFTIFRYCGIWWPDQSASPKNHFYRIYTISIITMVYIFTLTQILDMVNGNYDIDEITNNSFLMLTMIGLCIKVTNFSLRRRSIVTLLNILRNDICRPQNDSEIKIQKHFDGVARFVAPFFYMSNTLYFSVLSETTTIAFLIIPLLTKSYEERTLPFKAWLPFSLSRLTIYWLIYIQQSISILISTNLNVASDTLVSGLLVQACAQLDILKDRITRMKIKPLVATEATFIADIFYDEYVELTVKRCVRHHIVIYEFAAMVQDVFGWVVFFQFFVSMLTVCSSVFKLSQNDSDFLEVISFSLYLACLLVQLLFYCWHGNEVKLKSIGVSDAVFASDWTSLKPKMRKSLTMLMKRSTGPIVITCGSMLTLSLGTFMMVCYVCFE
ncbi:odorant receptor 46a-like [Athalia rosae]|uniref:odorant receptor 46a-like n=1 Tax=Athalia rosae TaxID=37344 RepID=UPI002034239B|nr:odorant receptor 46a-like [Athalia rosae]